ncbi:CGG triplet repeat-binding protein 1-like [Aphis craccivora]|uniref:CGG triplet repeat-binding protein 1-like n=1 Tax=Aphis craccivora TaxID=307492 RepID=A0A6G0ZDH2_APHCR|nr:CGG triplet repeat-binding protein 1-like [Aphis craccivora]
MPKEKQSLAFRLKSYVSEFSDSSGPVFTTDGKILYCKLCDSKVGSDRKFNVQQHIDTAKHKAAIQRKQNDS